MSMKVVCLFRFKIFCCFMLSCVVLIEIVNLVNKKLLFIRYYCVKNFKVKIYIRLNECSELLIRIELIIIRMNLDYEC